MTYLKNIDVAYQDSGNIDAFGRLRVSNPEGIFDAQLTYDLQPLLFESLVTGSGASLAHDTTNRNALMTFSNSPAGSYVIMQTYDHFRYQPGKSQAIDITFCMVTGTPNVSKFVGYSDGTNGIEFHMNGVTPQVRLLSSTGHGNEPINQADWNLDKLDGSGASGITFLPEKVHIFVIDFQALYVGRVRVGFNINGSTVYVHEFLHANINTNPYIASANLPVRVGMSCTDTVSATMKYNCSTVVSEGGQDIEQSYSFESEGTATAGNGARTPILTIRPKKLFNSIVNRSRVILEDIEVLVTGNSPVKWELCLGQDLTSASYTNANATYSSVEYDTSGSLSGSPAIIFQSGYTPASNQTKGNIRTRSTSRFPITLDHNGDHRSLGTVSVVVTGIGGDSACRVILHWREVR